MPRPSRKHAERTDPERKDSQSGPVQRGIWSGSISFGLVTIPVELYSAARRQRAAMRMLGPDGVPLARQFVCPEDGRVLSDDEIVRGYPMDGKFVVVTDEELESLAPRRSRDIELIRFVDREAIDPVYFVSTYLVLPGEGKTKAYRLLAETMEEAGRAALADFVMRGKAHAVAILADGGLLRAVTLRYSDELRTAEAMGIAAPARVDSSRIAEMKRAIGKLMAAEIDESELRDDSNEKLLERARQKVKRGEDVVSAPERADEEMEDESGASADVVDLVDLIRKRMRAEPARAKKSSVKKKEPPLRKIHKVPSRSESRSSRRAS